ncbi:NAD(P)/FAD-dependent oxidoreductase [Actinomycetospora sp. TBRC 11914]|uniref:flavin-containing monooxygenase n=1 Tax=Actinomycetospora sp. TBRC 11914 TaxID=2729387 RepID=UPI00145F6C00|nr:NAD(P)-binding domain-containing protein [Actinomycetospora sp. TBRC 11914]NMO88264.1 NAD(P)-binding domain-containing protein [Actinomycetospora sp. TBRC 11914]
MKACIIGGGVAGITAAKALAERGLDFDWFEQGSAIGGMWRYENDSGTSSAYRSLQIDTSSRSLAFPDFPIPPDRPAYLRHSQVLAYLEAYAEHFGVADRVQTSTPVRSVRRDDRGWAVTVGEETPARRYDAVIVANGHLSTPRRPEVPGHFDGEQLHSHHYRTPEPYTGRRVVVVGMGNSACDIAVDLARVASQVHLATRSTAWILPKYLLGRPTDHWNGLLVRKLRLPTRVARNIVRLAVRLVVGDQERFGVPRPPHRIDQAHGTVGQELLQYVAYGWIQVTPAIERLDGGEVVLTDGTRRAADAIVWATGYRPSFPFLPDDVVASADEGARLYRRIVHPDEPGLFFSGLVQPVGPTIPLVEVQGRWIADVLAGVVPLPERAAAEREIEAHRRWVRRTFVRSERHRLEVDFRAHTAALREDMARTTSPGPASDARATA